MSSARWIALLSSTWALVACGSNAPIVFMPPGSDGQQTMVLFVERPGLETIAYVVAPARNPESITVGLAGSSGSAQLTAMLFECPPSSFGLAEGEVELLSEPGPVRMPEPTAIHGRSETEVGWRERSASEADEALLARLPQPSDALCAYYFPRWMQRPIQIATQPSQLISASIAIGTTRLLVTTDAGRMFDVDIVSEDVLEITDAPAGTPIVAGTADGSSGAWLLGGDGRLHRGDPDAGFQHVATLAAIPSSTIAATFPVFWMAASGERVFVQNESDILIEYDGVTSRVVVAPRPVAEIEASFYTGGIAFDGADVLSVPATTFADRAGGIASLQTGQVESIRRLGGAGLMSEPSLEHPTIVASLPTLGTVVGSRFGLLLERSAGQWVRRDDAQVDTQITALAERDGAFLVGTKSGTFHGYDARVGFCDAEPTNPSVRAVHVMGDEVVLVSRPPEPTSSSLGVAVLRAFEAPRRDSCSQ